VCCRAKLKKLKLEDFENPPSSEKTEFAGKVEILARPPDLFPLIAVVRASFTDTRSAAEVPVLQGCHH
jgi:hypothetical protein